MATSRKEPHQPNASRTNRGVRNMSPVLKPRGEPDDAQGILRRARSVPSSPDRRSSASAAASSSSSSNACRPSSSFNPRRTASSRSSGSSASSSSSSSSASTHGKTPLPFHSVASSMVGAKQAAGVMRRRADKSTAGATSVRPHTSPDKDPASKPAKSPSSNVQKSKPIPTRPGAEKTATAAPSPKPRTQKATGAGAAGKTPAAASSSARNIPGATAKRRPAGTTETSVPSIRRTTSVPVPAAPKAAHQEPDVDDQLLMEEFDETESISTPSIEEHLQQRLPDPVDVVTAFTTTTSELHVDAPTPSEKPSSSSREEEHQTNQEAVITEHMMVAEEKHEHLNGGDDADVASKEAAAEVVDDVESLKKEAAESNEAAIETGSVGKIELKGDVGDEPTKSNEAVDGEETKLQEADGEAELKDLELLRLAVKKEAEVKANEERTVLPATKTAEAVQRWRTNEVTEDEGSSSRSKTAVQERRNKVMALVGRFETALSGSGRE